MSEKLPQIVAESPSWLVISKPAGWLTIPGRDPSERSVLSFLRERFPELLPVHRIDRQTSGLLLFAKTPEFHRQANGWFERHEIQKTYLALASGAPFLPSFQIRKPIEGARANTSVRVLEKFPGSAFLAEVQIGSGKRHQIRIHLAGEGHPLLGDVEYGGPREVGGVSIERVALHAWRLKLPSGESFEDPVPEDFSAWINRLKTDRLKGEKA